MPADERPTSNAVERAFQLAEECTSVHEIRARLKQEGYLSVDAHLAGKQLRDHLRKIFRQHA